MQRTFSKPAEARQLEARARARTRGVKVAVVSEARRYVAASQQRPGVVYAIERTPAGWACSCQGYESCAGGPRRACPLSWLWGGQEATEGAHATGTTPEAPRPSEGFWRRLRQAWRNR